MKYPNLNAAWLVMWADNMTKPMPSGAYDKLVAVLEHEWNNDTLEAADAELGEHRLAGDVDDIDSPLWEICCGEPVDGRISDDLNLVLEEMFDATGVDYED